MPCPRYTRRFLTTHCLTQRLSVPQNMFGLSIFEKDLLFWITRAIQILQATVKYACGSQILQAMKLLEILVILPTYLFPHSEKYFMSCLDVRFVLSKMAEVCPTTTIKNTSMHIQARLDDEDWKEGHFFIPKISLYKITLSTYCIVTKWTNEDIVIGSCGIISPRRKHCGTITTNQHPHPLIMRQHLFSFHSSWGFTWRQASFFERENSWKWTPQTCFPQFHIKAGFWCWETSWKWTPQTCSQETLKHFHEKTSRNSPTVCFLPQNMFDLLPYTKCSQCLFTSQQIYSKCLLSFLENV